MAITGSTATKVAAAIVATTAEVVAVASTAAKVPGKATSRMAIYPVEVVEKIRREEGVEEVIKVVEEVVGCCQRRH